VTIQQQQVWGRISRPRERVEGRTLDLERPPGEDVDEGAGLVCAPLLPVGDRRLVQLLAPVGGQSQVRRVANVVDLVAKLEHTRPDDLEQGQEVCDRCPSEAGK
jgi:hypothetical protein